MRVALNVLLVLALAAGFLHRAGDDHPPHAHSRAATAPKQASDPSSAAAHLSGKIGSRRAGGRGEQEWRCAGRGTRAPATPITASSSLRACPRP